MNYNKQMVKSTSRAMSIVSVNTVEQIQETNILLEKKDQGNKNK